MRANVNHTFSELEELHKRARRIYDDAIVAGLDKNAAKGKIEEHNKKYPEDSLPVDAGEHKGYVARDNHPEAIRDHFREDFRDLSQRKTLAIGVGALICGAFDRSISGKELSLYKEVIAFSKGLIYDPILG